MKRRVEARGGASAATAAEPVAEETEEEEEDVSLATLIGRPLLGRFGSVASREHR